MKRTMRRGYRQYIRQKRGSKLSFSLALVKTVPQIEAHIETMESQVNLDCLFYVHVILTTI